MPRMLAGIVPLVAAVTLAACATDDTTSSPESTATTEAAQPESGADDEQIIPVLLGETAEFSTLLTAIEAAGLTDTLGAEGPYTVWAPTDEAFAQLPAEVLDALLLPENDTELTSVLTYHVTEGAQTSDELVTQTLVALSGESLSVIVDDEGVTVGDATVIVPRDLEASNGVVHAIDTVLVPPDVDLDALVMASSDG